MTQQTNLLIKTWKQRLFDLLRALPKNPIPQRQPTHEYRQHCRLRLHRAPEHQREVFRPNHLINQRRRPGQKKQNENNHAKMEPPAPRFERASPNDSPKQYRQPAPIF